jgi:hypothetical protein
LATAASAKWKVKLLATRKTVLMEVRKTGRCVASLPREADFRPAKDEVAAEESGEKHALGEKEHDHAEFGDGGRGARMGVGIVGQGGAGHGVRGVFLKKKSGRGHWTTEVHKD